MINRPKRVAKVEPVIIGTSAAPGYPRTAYRVEDLALIISQNHKRVPGTDWGGPFYQRRLQKGFTPDSRVRSYNAGAYRYEGIKYVPGLTTQTTLPTLTPLPSWAGEQSLLAPHFATGWKRSRPGNPVSDVGQWIAELRQLPSWPLAAYRRLRNFRALGSEYLNVQFGWVPFVSELRKMYETYQTLDKRLDDLVRNNGKGIRRRRNLGDTTNTTSTTNSFPGSLAAFQPTLSFVGLSGNSLMITQTITKEKIWFAGRFRYYVPDIGSSQWTARATRALYGANPTPSLLWEILPWSWLIDWFSNVGDVVSNLSTNAVDNLTADYAYVMRTKSTTVITTSTGIIHPYTHPTDPSRNIGGSTVNASSFSIEETKSRVRGSPYGLGITYSGLSAYQLSILGALGISRSRF